MQGRRLSRQLNSSPMISWRDIKKTDGGRPVFREIEDWMLEEVFGNAVPMEIIEKLLVPDTVNTGRHKLTLQIAAAGKRLRFASEFEYQEFLGYVCEYSRLPVFITLTEKAYAEHLPTVNSRVQSLTLRGKVRGKSGCVDIKPIPLSFSTLTELNIDYYELLNFDCFNEIFERLPLRKFVYQCIEKIPPLCDANLEALKSIYRCQTLEVLRLPIAMVVAAYAEIAQLSDLKLLTMYIGSGKYEDVEWSKLKLSDMPKIRGVYFNCCATPQLLKPVLAQAKRLREIGISTRKEQLSPEAQQVDMLAALGELLAKCRPNIALSCEFSDLLLQRLWAGQCYKSVLGHKLYAFYETESPSIQIAPAKSRFDAAGCSRSPLTQGTSAILPQLCSSQQHYGTFEHQIQFMELLFTDSSIALAKIDTEYLR